VTGFRVFLDANVLFSASNTESAFSKLLKWTDERAQLVSSDLARLEAERNLTLRRPSWLPGFHELAGIVQWTSTSRFEVPVELAEKDIPLLCSAIRARCDLFVTGDRRDFGHLFRRTVLGTTVVSPTDLMDALTPEDGS